MGNEKYIVKVSIDNSRSHTAGIMPYITYNSDDQNIKYVSMDNDSGNWGNFPLDIAFMRESAEEGFGGLGVKRRRFRTSSNEGCRYSTTENRLRYSEMIKRYYELQKMLDGGIFTLAIVKRFSSDGKIVCEEEDCRTDKRSANTYTEVVLNSNFDAVEMSKIELTENGEVMPEQYMFKPVPIEDFIEYAKGVYRKNGDTEIEEGKYYVIVNDYQKYVEYERVWKEWWAGNGVNVERKFPVQVPYFKFCAAVEKYFIGKAIIPDSITGIRVPPFIYYTDIEEYKDWFEKNDLTSEESLIGKPDGIIKRFKENGGLEFYRFLTRLGQSAPWIVSIPKNGVNYDFTYVTPYISIPISLEDEHEYGGIYENYIYSYSEKDDEYYEAYKDFDGYGDKDVMSWYEPDTDIYGMSMLSYVVDSGATEIENITGVWADFQSSNLFKCTFVLGEETGSGERVVEKVKVGREYGYWRCNSVQPTYDMVCGDGENLSSGSRKYRSVTLLECIRDIVPTPRHGDTYYFLVRHDNCAEHPFRIPYSVGTYHNMKETDEEGIYIGDYVTSIEKGDEEIIIQYVIGGTASSSDGGLTFTKIDNTGVKYEERFAYKPYDTMKTFVDGHDGVVVYYEYMDTESSKERIYSEEYRLYRMGNRAKILGIEVGTIFTGNSKNAINAMLFTRDGSEYLPDETNNKFEVMIDRGMAAAFERHFKLTECNTFEDLKNYGNNFYKL